MVVPADWRSQRAVGQHVPLILFMNSDGLLCVNLTIMGKSHTLHGIIVRLNAVLDAYIAQVNLYLEISELVWNLYDKSGKLTKCN